MDNHMEKLIIDGGRPLNGDIEISGAKNAAVAILPSAIMASKGICVIDNIPMISDTECIERIIESLGATVTRKNITNRKAHRRNSVPPIIWMASFCWKKKKHKVTIIP